MKYFNGNFGVPSATHTNWKFSRLSIPTQVFRAKWFMVHYGSRTPKPHYAWGNSRHVRELSMGPLVGWAKRRLAQIEEGTLITTCERYVDKNGKVRYKGTRQLRQTEFLST